MIGQSFGLWTVIDQAPPVLLPDGKHKTCWLVLCRCGTERVVRANDLRTGASQSCGCTRNKHGMSRTKVYRAWQNMLNRCYNPKHPLYKWYGKRGIRVCPRWRNSFESFYADVGDPPINKPVIDRYPDNDGGYRPGNIRWATWRESAANRRNTGGR